MIDAERAYERRLVIFALGADLSRFVLATKLRSQPSSRQLQLLWPESPKYPEE